MSQTIYLPDGGNIEVQARGRGYGEYRVDITNALWQHSFTIAGRYTTEDAEHSVAQAIKAVVGRALKSVGGTPVPQAASVHGTFIDQRSVSAGKSGEVDVLKLYRKDGKYTVRVLSGKSNNEYVVQKQNGVVVCSCIAGSINGNCRHAGHVNKLVRTGEWTI